MIVTMTTAAAAVGEYAIHCKAQGYPASTTAQYVRYAQRALKGRDPSRITTAQLEDWIAAHDWAPSTHRSAVVALHSFFAWAKSAGLRPDDPTVGLGSPPEPPPCPKPAPSDVVEHAMRAYACTDVGQLIRLAATTGLRRGELCRVHSRDVERRNGGWWLRVYGKGRKVRLVPVPVDVAQWLLSQHGYAFPGRYGGHCRPDTITQKMKRATGYSPHTFRHYYATCCYQRSRNIRAVQRLLGHASVGTTQRYIATDDSELMEAAAATWAA